MILEELLIPLGLEVSKENKKEIDDFTRRIKKLTLGVGLLTGALATASTAISAFVLSVAKGTEDISRAAGVLGIATSTLDKWNGAANLATGSTRGMATEMGTLARHASEAARGIGSSVQTFGLLSQYGFSGVYDDAGRLKDTERLLSEVADAISRIDDPSRRVEMAEKLGLRSLLPLLMKGSSGISELTDLVESLGVATDEDAEKARELMLSWRSLKIVFADISRTVMRGVAPELRRIVQAVTDWYKANREILSQNLAPFFRSLGSLVAVFWRVLVRTTQAVYELTSRTIGLRAALYSLMLVLAALLALMSGAAIVTAVAMAQKLATALGLISAGAVAAKMALVVSIAAVLVLLTLIALVIEDIWTSLEGGEGLLAGLPEKVKLIGIPLQVVSMAIVIIANNLKMIYELLQNPLSKDSWLNAARALQENLEFAKGEAMDIGMKIAKPSWIARMALPGLGASPSEGTRGAPSVSVSAPITITSTNGDPEDMARVIQRHFTEVFTGLVQDLATPVTK